MKVRGSEERTGPLVGHLCPAPILVGRRKASECHNNVSDAGNERDGELVEPPKSVLPYSKHDFRAPPFCISGGCWLVSSRFAASPSAKGTFYREFCVELSCDAPLFLFYSIYPVLFFYRELCVELSCDAPLSAEASTRGGFLLLLLLTLLLLLLLIIIIIVIVIIIVMIIVIGIGIAPLSAEASTRGEAARAAGGRPSAEICFDTIQYYSIV